MSGFDNTARLLKESHPGWTVLMGDVAKSISSRPVALLEAMVADGILVVRDPDDRPDNVPAYVVSKPHVHKWWVKEVGPLRHAVTLGCDCLEEREVENVWKGEPHGPNAWKDLMGKIVKVAPEDKMPWTGNGWHFGSTPLSKEEAEMVFEAIVAHDTKAEADA